MGTVYLARDTKLGRQVAIKIPMLVAGGNSRAQRFREARAPPRSASQPVSHYEVDAIDGVDYLAMATSKADAFRFDPKRQALAGQASRRIGPQIALAMEERTPRRGPSRPKPSNIMIDLRRQSSWILAWRAWLKTRRTKVKATNRH